MTGFLYWKQPLYQLSHNHCLWAWRIYEIGSYMFMTSTPDVTWSRGYGRRLMIQRSWVRFPALYTEWTFFAFIYCQNCNCKTKINSKRGRGWPFCFEKRLTSHVRIRRFRSPSTRPRRQSLPPSCSCSSRGPSSCRSWAASVGTCSARAPRRCSSTGDYF